MGSLILSLSFLQFGIPNVKKRLQSLLLEPSRRNDEKRLANVEWQAGKNALNFGWSQFKRCSPCFLLWFMTRLETPFSGRMSLKEGCGTIFDALLEVPPR